VAAAARPLLRPRFFCADGKRIIGNPKMPLFSVSLRCDVKKKPKNADFSATPIDVRPNPI
jgi:hypothetical protein